jgi:hypothetical protein
MTLVGGAAAGLSYVEIRSMEPSMADREQSNLSERAAKQQVQQQFTLLLEIQTMSLMLNDLRSRISEIEKYLGMDKQSPLKLPSIGNVTRLV